MYAGPPCRVSETSFISQRLHGRARAPASRLEYLKGSPLQKSNRLECGTIHDQFEVPLKFFLPESPLSASAEFSRIDTRKLRSFSNCCTEFSSYRFEKTVAGSSSPVTRIWLCFSHPNFWKTDSAIKELYCGYVRPWRTSTFGCSPAVGNSSHGIRILRPIGLQIMYRVCLSVPLGTLALHCAE